ncbi:MAG: hypothetical protein HC849_24405 [Oscillatoriales cyanobacterium RU_3_3]|nr:hypothetical protein [Oscillatoriales cyanobacterium RU_3_3]
MRDNRLAGTGYRTQALLNWRFEIFWENSLCFPDLMYDRLQFVTAGISDVPKPNSKLE